MNKVLVTGFEPFDGGDVNPSQEVAAALNGRVISGHPVVGVTLPCVYGDSRRKLERLLRSQRPAAVICLGLAGGAAAIRVERVAINLEDARIADNRGRQPRDRPVVRGGPAAYFTALPAKAIVRRLTEHGIGAVLSESAGTFVCNHVFYGLMHAVRRRPRIAAGFIHLPWLPQQAGRREHSLPLDTMVHAVALAIEASVTHRVVGYTR